jgi:hypothetical protein
MKTEVMAKECRINKGEVDEVRRQEKMKRE